MIRFSVTLSLSNVIDPLTFNLFSFTKQFMNAITITSFVREENLLIDPALQILISTDHDWFTM